MVANPTDYQRSSYNARLGPARDCDWLDIDACFTVLWDVALERGQLTGNARFVDDVEKIAGISIEHRERGRPSKVLENKS